MTSSWVPPPDSPGRILEDGKILVVQFSMPSGVPGYAAMAF